jgi:hypothetical protein
MEDVLSVYARQYDPDYPVICNDEKPVQLLGDSRKPIPMSEKNHTKLEDGEYMRNGTCSIFMFTEPLGCWRESHVREHRTKKDWAREIKWLLDEQYPDAKKVVLVNHNLNTHGISSLYEAFPPQESFRLASRLEIHYTPKHGSWLDIAECELSSLTNQCLENRRIDNIDDLRKEVLAWSANKNARQKGVDWQFTTEQARIKLKTLYPVIELKN